MRLTDEQIDKLAGKLVHSSQNVFRVAEKMFGVEVEDEVFDQLQKVGKIFKCEQCDQWLPIADLEKNFDELCKECAGA